MNKCCLALLATTFVAACATTADGHYFDSVRPARDVRGGDIGEVAADAASHGSWKLTCWREKTLGSNRLEKICEYRRTGPTGCPDCGKGEDRN